MRLLLSAFSKPIVVVQFREIYSEKSFRESKSPDLAWPWPHHRGLLEILRLREPRGGRSPEETAVPIGLLSDAERERLDSFPAQVVPGDIETYFTLSRADRRQVPRTGSPANRLGFALQLGTLRFLGFCPDDLGTAPEAVRLFREVGRVVLDSKVKDADLRRAIYRRIPAAELRDAVTESDRIIRPLDDHYFDFLESRYTYLRQFTPEFIEALAFRSAADSPLLRAVGLLRQLNAEGRRVLPDETPLEFVPTRWRPYVNDNPDPTERRHYFELCVLWELRGALRAGDVWLEGSRRYADPETYLNPRDPGPARPLRACLPARWRSGSHADRHQILARARSAAY